MQQSSSLKSIIVDLDRAEQRARAILDGLSDAQANWQPAVTAWSIVQCVDHLARTNTVYLQSLRQATKGAEPAARPVSEPIRPGTFCSIFIRTLEPPPNAKIRARKIVVPSPRVDKDDALRVFLESHDRLRAFVRESEALDLNRIRFQNPFVGFLRFRVGAGLLIIAAHERRHLWQAEQVRQAPEFPPVS